MPIAVVATESPVAHRPRWTGLFRTPIRTLPHASAKKEKKKRVIVHGRERESACFATDSCNSIYLQFSRRGNVQHQRQFRADSGVASSASDAAHQSAQLLIQQKSLIHLSDPFGRKHSASCSTVHCIRTSQFRPVPAVVGNAGSVPATTLQLRRGRTSALFPSGSFFTVRFRRFGCFVPSASGGHSPGAASESNAA